MEGDFRYVESGAFDECTDFLAYLDDYKYDWESAFVGWIGVSRRWKDHRKLSQNYWGPWNLVKVLKFSVLSISKCGELIFPFMFSTKILFVFSFLLMANKKSVL